MVLLDFAKFLASYSKLSVVPYSEGNIYCTSIIVMHCGPIRAWEKCITMELFNEINPSPFGVGIDPWKYLAISILGIFSIFLSFSYSGIWISQNHPQDEPNATFSCNHQFEVLDHHSHEINKDLLALNYSLGWRHFLMKIFI